MREESHWKPTKFVQDTSGWVASSDPSEVSVSSRLIATTAVAAYQAALQAHAKGRLVDLGCGKVPLYGVYRPLVDEVTCVDWPGSLHATSHVDVEIDLSSSHWPLPGASFDTVVLTDVLEHLPRPDVAWSEISRITAPGGIVIVGVPFLYWLHEQPHDFYRYTEYRLRMFCDEHNFTVRDLKPFGGGVQVIFDVAGKILARRRALARLVPTLQELGLKIGARGDSAALPLGYTLVAQRE